MKEVGKFFTDLIDTLWNVKKDRIQQRCERRRFNRYIVECKAHSVIISAADGVDLIDTLWNVKKSVNIVIDPSRSI